MILTEFRTAIYSDIDLINFEKGLGVLGKFNIEYLHQFDVLYDIQFDKKAKGIKNIHAINIHIRGTINWQVNTNGMDLLDRQLFLKNTDAQETDHNTIEGSYLLISDKEGWKIKDEVECTSNSFIIQHLSIDFSDKTIVVK